LVAVVADEPRGRVYLPATAEQIDRASIPAPSGIPDTDLPQEALGFRIQNYGIRKHWQMFTPRQLTAMVTLSDLVKDIRADVHRDALAAGLSGAEGESYAATIRTFLSLALDRSADFNNALCRWSPSNQKVMNLFARQAIPMVWDFAEANILGESVGAWLTCADYVADCVEVILSSASGVGHSRQTDAATGADGIANLLVSTDPPYYDNIGYAALSDFFYVWLRRTIGDLYPDLFSTVLVPKSQELTASPERFEGDKHKAKEHFESGFRRAFAALRERMNPEFPLTVYYAFKQDDEESGGDEESQDRPTRGKVDLTTGWETMLQALIGTGFQITATWPVRASQAWRMRAMGSNALASYIVLACRPRPENAPQTDRRSFIAELKRELPAALRHLQQGNVAPVDFAQAAIGPGMAIYSRYSRILEASGRQMSVRTALALINQTLTEVLSEQEDEFDTETRWAIAWYEQHGFEEGEYGDAELLSKAKVTSVEGLKQAGIVHSRAGKVRLLRPQELPKDWDPASDRRLTHWELTHHLLRVYYHEKAGDAAAAKLLRQMGAQGELARDLAYRLFSISERKNRSQEAQAYNALALGWPEIARLALASSKEQGALFQE
jgi:putative DNA methylase